MSASRPKRPFNPQDLAGKGEEQRSRLIFDWWCDETNRAALLRHWGKSTQTVASRSPQQDDPAPLLTTPSPQGRRDIRLVLDPALIDEVLLHPARYSNQPYAALGGAGFLLAMDAPGNPWHAEQRQLISRLLGAYSAPALRDLAGIAVRQAALGALTADRFDLVAWAEQAALRYLGQLFGFSFSDHPLLEDSARAAYRALHYLSFAQHFTSEPGCANAGQQALTRLASRAAALMGEYAELAHSPRPYEGPATNRWPVGVQPWSALGVAPLGSPLLKQLGAEDGKLSGRDLATLAACLLAGTAGNLVNAACTLGEWLLAQSPAAVATLPPDAGLEAFVDEHLQRHPPVRALPRRVCAAGFGGQPPQLGSSALADNEELLLILPEQAAVPAPQLCPHAWGAAQGGAARHACLGRTLSTVFLAALLRELAALRGLRQIHDTQSALPLGVERQWGLICTRFPLAHDRDRRRAQRNLIVSMRVKPPLSENAAKLRRLIAAGLPRIEHALDDFRHVHFAWFEFSDDDSRLVLRTLYDGDFDAYLEFFARRAGDLFDHLFDYLEDAPPRPVREHAREFVDTIRRHNRAPLAGYLYSAYPTTTVDQIP